MPPYVTAKILFPKGGRGFHRATSQDLGQEEYERGAFRLVSANIPWPNLRIEHAISF